MGTWPQHRYFQSVVNAEAQYSIWPVDTPLPAGWRAVGFAGTRLSCLSFVAEVWRDMRPLSVRDRDGRADGERSDGVPEANGEAVPATLVAHFSRSVRRHPGAVAVGDGQQQLTYAQLAERSDRLAAGLVALGVLPEDLVVLRLPSTVDSVVALVGVVKAGAAGLPVDAGAPASDVDTVLRRGGVRLVLTAPGAARSKQPGGPGPAPPGPAPPGPAPQGPAPPIVDLDSVLAAAGRGTAGRQPAAGNAACVLPAAGRGGEVRHVVLEHRQLVPPMLDPVMLPLHEGDRTASALGVAAAEAQVEIWRALAAGAEVVVLSPEERTGAGLTGALRRNVSVLSAPAAQVARLVGPAPPDHAGRRPAPPAGSGLPDALASLRMLHVTGTGLQPDTVRTLRAAGFTGRLLTRFGPVETATVAAVHELPDEPATDADPPLGGPAAAVQLYVLDEELCPVPPGSPGQLYVGGAVVGRGYLDQPELTADRFLPDPFSSGGRIYATGALATQRVDGRTHYLGPAEPDP
jgi:non-ribosomal peptide synthetase component F